jgi:hypothetical protein
MQDEQSAQPVPEAEADAAEADAAEADAAEADPDPRPVYDGDWLSATGVEKGRHSQRVREWKARQKGVARSRMAPSPGQPVAALPSRDAADGVTRAVLEGIRDNPGAHDSDRIRAAQQLIALDRAAEGVAHAPSPLYELRLALELLPPHERLAWLQGERAEHLGA